MHGLCCFVRASTYRARLALLAQHECSVETNPAGKGACELALAKSHFRLQKSSHIGQSASRKVSKASVRELYVLLADFRLPPAEHVVSSVSVKAGVNSA